MFYKLEPMQSKDRDGRLPQSESYIVGTLALMQREVGLHAVEIGTFYGETTTNIARAMPCHHVLTVDLPEGCEQSFAVHENDKRLALLKKEPQFGEDVRDRIQQIYADSASMELSKLLEIGFAFIDGSHTYEYAHNDFNKISPLLVNGGMVVFHDVMGGVGKAVQEIIDSTPRWLWSAYGGTSLVWGVKL